MMTGLFDASRFATCRMYGMRPPRCGRACRKNATEGMAKPVRAAGLDGAARRGQVLPLALPGAAALAWAALLLPIGLRLVLAVAVPPAAVAAPCCTRSGLRRFLVLQWVALARAAAGRGTTWRGRAYPAP